MSSTIDYDVTDNIAVLTIKNPPVNALSHAVRNELILRVKQLNKDDSAEAAILICAGRTFIAGADILEFNKPPLEPLLLTVIAEIESSNKLIVAAIHGTALGGGFETAMACHYRCALSSARVGLPEVKLGLLPGATGTQRLPRLVGIKKSLDIIIGGDPIIADEAYKIGAIDRIFHGELLQGALEYTRELIKTNNKPRRLSESSIDGTGIDKKYFIEYRQQIEQKFRGYLSPQKIVDCVEAALNLSYIDAVKLERQRFNECKASNQSKALRYLFFAERQVSKIPGISKDIPLREISKVAVIGAGTMGSGIAINFLNAGLPVYLVDKDETSLNHGINLVRNFYEDEIRKGRLNNEDLNERVAMLTATMNISQINEADLVIESVFEDLEAKKQVFKELDTVCKPGTVLASNTSTLDINSIAKETTRPEDVIGMHFFAPASKMKLVEIVRAAKTADEVLATIINTTRTINKTGVVVGVCFGFVGNRMFLPYLREAQLMVLEGLSPDYIDKVAYQWGFPMGPFKVMDMSGLDVFYSIYQQFGEAPGKYSYFPLSKVLYENGRLGQKSGIGFYQYGNNGAVLAPEVKEIAAREAETHGICPRKINDDEIIERLLYSMINEGALLLEEGIALRPGDIDVIFVNGYGFPRYRGGPMCYADTVSTKKVYEGICGYRERYGEMLWNPADSLQQLAIDGNKFNVD